ncbi:MAG: hypothetical protein MZU97_21890 [Bacillus subtilis]|nr:hypothetical protein [Bacillus subtilis]
MIAAIAGYTCTSNTAFQRTLADCSRRNSICSSTTILDVDRGAFHVQGTTRRTRRSRGVAEVYRWYYGMAQYYAGDYEDSDSHARTKSN